VVRINRERGTTILLVEQNANMALNAADYGYVLEERPHRDEKTAAPACARRPTSRSSTSA
jgi:branched-chain amino acid transport system ATP-binding protein